MRHIAGACAMTDPLLGLAVALCLGLYLAYTLIHPEKF
ncbi:MAG: potassium-transporting ATPase subunit F [Hyphomicrobiales bacterium]|nr:potassium-transporting ATPase subunit F [Hyphomicrobiales bacterium]MDE2114239.1 potassium-transporting ATPase subunit F [Hyphomicrobiales bacterium]